MLLRESLVYPKDLLLFFASRALLRLKLLRRCIFITVAPKGNFGTLLFGYVHILVSVLLLFVGTRCIVFILPYCICLLTFGIITFEYFLLTSEYAFHLCYEVNKVICF